MTKPGEYTYFSRIGEEGREHSINKPFSDNETSRFFMDMGALFSLLPPPPARILECGCGTGWLSYFLARKGYDVVGQDCCADAIELAEANQVFIKKGNVEFICSDFEGLDYDEKFDGVIFYASLHHSEDPERAIARSYKVLKHGGVFVAIEPGLGHGKKSKQTREEFYVGDRDMPAHLVVKYGKKVGFRQFKIYQHAGQLVSTLYNDEPHSEIMKRIWRISGVRIMALLSSILFYKQFNGTVWMKK